MRASTSAPTLRTASATLALVCDALSVHTTLSATASVFAEPVTVMPLLERDAKPAPTFTNPPPTAIAMMTATTISVIALVRSIADCGLFMLMVLF